GQTRRRSRLGFALLRFGDNGGWLAAHARLRAQALLRLDDADLARGGLVNFRRILIDAGGDHRNAHDAVEALVESRAQNDIGLLVDLLANAACRFVDLIE